MRKQKDTRQTHIQTKKKQKMRHSERKEHKCNDCGIVLLNPLQFWCSECWIKLLREMDEQRGMDKWDQYWLYQDSRPRKGYSPSS